MTAAGKYYIAGLVQSGETVVQMARPIVKYSTVVWVIQQTETVASKGRGIWPADCREQPRTQFPVSVTQRDSTTINDQHTKEAGIPQAIVTGSLPIILLLHYPSFDTESDNQRRTLLTDPLFLKLGCWRLLEAEALPAFPHTGAEAHSAGVVHLFHPSVQLKSLRWNGWLC